MSTNYQNNTTEEVSVQTGIVDSEVHVYPRNADEIKRYLPSPLKQRFHFWENPYYINPIKPQRAVTPDGGKPGTDPSFLREQLLQDHGIANAILLPQAFVSRNNDPYYSAALATAYNDWLSDTWLNEFNKDGVFKGSITIAHQDPALAVKEIDRLANHQHFVQVLMDSGARAPFGQRHYHPIYEACQRHGLPLVIHPGTDGMGINDLASPGYPSHFLEWHTGFSFAMQSHLLSMFTEGVFELFPELKIVIAEGGVVWLPTFMWGVDAGYKALRTEIPWVKKLPSEYLLDHLRITTQSLEDSASDTDLLDVLSMFDYADLLLYSSNYPDEHFSSPDSLSFMPQQAQKRILSDNVKKLYRI
jgi:predicted TIM-barrel fold metal-dependent hydrolase